MSLSRDDFGSFFAELHDGHRPFAWQERLLDSVLTESRWPDRIVAPTGAGKTAVIDIHVFAQALTSVAGEARLPRRLSLVVGRRVLVDDQHEYAERLADRLARHDSDLLKEISNRLWKLRSPAGSESTSDDPSPLVVGRLRGGYLPSRAWRDYPTAAAILCATPDMWGSRLLFRGYGASSRAWPREAGLLATDSVVVVDEAHLATQLLYTARRVGELAAITEGVLVGQPLQVVETTATPAGQVSGIAPDNGEGTKNRALVSVGVESADLLEGPLLDRLTRPKPVRIRQVNDWAATRDPQRRKVVAVIADAVVDIIADARLSSYENDPSGPVTSDTVGCFVNSVARAVDVATELRSRVQEDRTLRVVLICGQIRPHDLEKLRANYPGLLEPTGNAQIDVIVATQSLEVGVDLDLAAMVTELASGSAIAQRSGRVNRRGLRASGQVIVVAPADAIDEKTRSGPYGSAELLAALDWLRSLAATQRGLAPWDLRTNRPPGSPPRRPAYQRPELAQAWHWARTSDALTADPELDLWLGEDFGKDTSVSLVVRSSMPVETADAIRLIKALPPRPHELFPVPYRVAKTALRRPRPSKEKRENEEREILSGAVIFRDGDTEPVDWSDVADDPKSQEPRIRPGDVIVVDSRDALFTSSAAGGTEGFSPPVLAPLGEGAIDKHRAEDVLTAQADSGIDSWPQRVRGGVVLRIETGVLGVGQDAFNALGASLTAIPDDPLVTDHEEAAANLRTGLRGWLQNPASMSQTRMVQAAVELLAETPKSSELIVNWSQFQNASAGTAANEEPVISRVILIDRRRPVVDEGLRQIWTRGKSAVTLDVHQDAVASRAEFLAKYLGLSADLITALRLAGAHHDDGKVDGRFQIRLGGGGKPVLAKSSPGTTVDQARRNEGRCGLPSGWRHEQRSVIESWPHIQNATTDPLLVSRLIGTSHGHGRSVFPQVTGDLLRPQDGDELREVATDLFDLGGWDELIEQTQRTYGVWGCAYLEALLRAADGQVSEEGS